MFLVNFSEVHLACDGLFIVHLRFALVAFNLELTLQTVDNDIQVKLTHTRDNGLSTLLICVNSESRIFLCQLGKTVVKFCNISLALWLNSDGDNCIGECDAFENNWMVLVTECVTRAYILETNTGTNITSFNAIHWLLLVGVHLEESANTLLFARTSIIDIRTSFHLTGVNTEEHQSTYIWVCCNLKCKCRSRFIFAWLAIFLFAGSWIFTDNIRCVQWRRQECADIVKQSLNALVLE